MGNYDGVEADGSTESSCLKSKCEEVDKTQDENVYMRRVERRRVLTAGK